MNKYFLPSNYFHLWVYSWLLTVCPRSSYPFYVVSYYIKWVTTGIFFHLYMKCWVKKT